MRNCSDECREATRQAVANVLLEIYEAPPKPPVYWVNRLRDSPEWRPWCATEFEMAMIRYTAWWIRTQDGD